MWRRWSRTWRDRLFIALFISVACYGVAVLGKWGPQPVPYVVFMAGVLSLMWLVFDVADEEPVQWVPTLPSVSDRTDEATSDLRILTSHQRFCIRSIQQTVAIRISH